MTDFLVAKLFSWIFDFYQGDIKLSVFGSISAECCDKGNINPEMRSPDRVTKTYRQIYRLILAYCI